MTEGVSVQQGPPRSDQPGRRRPHSPLEPHLWNEHLDALKATEARGNREGTRVAFRDAHRGDDWLPVGQWLVAMTNCQDGHMWQMFGDPCYCGSDNCDYCARCGVEDHD